MPEPLGPIPVPRRPSEPEDRLDSWKEIAAYLGREVRTVQGWEKNEALPIHRHQHARQGSVYALRSELDAWRIARKVVAESPIEELSSTLVESEASSREWLPRVALLAILVLVIVAGFYALQIWRAAKSDQTIASVVVLPFVDMSPQHDQDYFSDGLTEEIIDALSRVPNLRVVARTSAFAFKGKANDVGQIGKQLDVGAVLDGSVRKDGDQLRITAHLNRVSDGTLLWSHTYDRQLRDVFKVQHELSQSIARELRAGSVPERRYTNDPDAYQSYQEGRYFFNQQEPSAYRKAIERFQRAIDQDPNFAMAYSGLADSYAYLAEHFAGPPREFMPKAKEAALKAIALDNNLAEAHTSLGIVKLDYEWDIEGGQAEFRRAMQLNPQSGWARHWYAHSLEAQRHIEDALREMRAALALDPLSLVIYWDIGTDLLGLRRYDEALAHLAKGDELFPNFYLLTWEKAEAYYAKHDLASAHREIEKMRTSNAGFAELPSFIALLGVGAAREGRTAEARKILDKLEEFRKTQYVEGFMAMELCSALGDHDRMQKWFERMREERSSLYLYLPLAAAGFAEQDAQMMEKAAKVGK